MDLETVKMIGETALVLGAVGVGAWRTTRVLGAVAERVASIPALAERVDELARDVGEVRGELGVNGGSTLRDAINRIETTGRQTAVRLDAHIDRTGR